MTYSLDIINLSIHNYNLPLKKSKICNLLNIRIKTLNNWLNKYNYYYTNNIQLTSNNYNDIKKQYEHKSTKKTKYTVIFIKML